MYKEKTFLAVIPARGGSVSVPKKNIHPLAGRPLIVYTIEQARAVPEIDLVVVSTDDQEIAAVAQGLGVRVIERPSELATATVPTELAILHALDTLAAERTFEYVMILEPTSPFRRPETVTRCVHEIVDRGGLSLLTVRETRASIGRLVEGRFHRLDPNAPRRRQDRESLYIETSTVYACHVGHLRATRTVVADNWLAVPVDELESHDINTPQDFLVAEAMLEAKRSRV